MKENKMAGRIDKEHFVNTNYWISSCYLSALLLLLVSELLSSFNKIMINCDNDNSINDNDDSCNDNDDKDNNKNDDYNNNSDNNNENENATNGMDDDSNNN